MLSAGIRTLKELAMDESMPLAVVHEAIIQFARDRSDIVIFGAHAVNAFVDEPRMTQDVDMLTTDARTMAEELRAHLAATFGATIRILELTPKLAYRIYQVRKPSNRHLADIRGVAQLPTSIRVDGVLVPVPAELIAHKLIALVARRGTPKSGSDWRDIATLLLRFPELKVFDGDVLKRLHDHMSGEAVIQEWLDTVSREIIPDNEEY